MLSVDEYYQHDNENKQTSHGSGEAFQPSDVVLGRDYKRCFLALECDLRKPLRANGPISRESLPYPQPRGSWAISSTVVPTGSRLST